MNEKNKSLDTTAAGSCMIEFGVDALIRATAEVSAEWSLSVWLSYVIKSQ